MFFNDTERGRRPLRQSKALQVPMFRGEKMAMSLASPMIGNFMGVKANNSFCIVDKLRFLSLMLNNCSETEIWQFCYGRRRLVRSANYAVCSSGKLVRPRTRPITPMVARWYRIRDRILAVFWRLCLARVGPVMRFLVVIRELGT